VREYIARQKEHQRKKSFQEEYRLFLQRHGVAFDERMSAFLPAPTARFNASPGQRPGNQTQYNHPTLKGRFKPCHNPSPAFMSTWFSAPRERSLHDAARELSRATDSTPRRATERGFQLNSSPALPQITPMRYTWMTGRALRGRQSGRRSALQDASRSSCATEGPAGLGVRARQRRFPPGMLRRAAEYAPCLSMPSATHRK
jgi:hypothetical protein